MVAGLAVGHGEAEDVDIVRVRDRLPADRVVVGKPDQQIPRWSVVYNRCNRRPSHRQRCRLVLKVPVASEEIRELVKRQIIKQWVVAELIPMRHRDNGRRDAAGNRRGRDFDR